MKKSTKNQGLLSLIILINICAYIYLKAEKELSHDQLLHQNNHIFSGNAHLHKWMRGCQ